VNVAKLQGMVTLGILSGPVVGSLMATLSPTRMIAYALPGWLSIFGSVGLYALTHYMFHDHEILPSAPKPSTHGGEDDVPAEVKVVALCVNVNQFFACLGSMAGFESLMSIMALDSYGWGPSEQFGTTWLPFAVGCAAVTLNMPIIMQRFNFAQLALANLFLFNTGLIGIQFTNLSIAAPLWRFYLAMVGLYIGPMVYVMHLGLLTARVPAAYQVKYGSMAQSLGQAGRAIGPIVATQWYSLVTERFTTAAGASASWAFLWITTLVSVGFPALYFKTLYGSLGDLTAHQKAQAIKGKGGMV
jgi:hypothetical protein